MKGIVLAGGTGSRLFPATLGVCKQLLPVYNKPMIYYPLSVLMLAGLREILLITTPHDISLFRRMLGDGSSLGISIEYATQPHPNGIAEAFIIGEEFLNGDSCILILGDNIFYGSGFSDLIKQSMQNNVGCTIFGYHVSNPEKYGVVRFGDDGQVLELLEKPKLAPSNTAVTGLYIYDHQVCQFARDLKPSSRCELEITDINNCYLHEEKLTLTNLPRGSAWLDTGTYESLLDASQFVRAIEASQGLSIGSIEEIAYRKGWIDESRLDYFVNLFSKTSYGEYLKRLQV